MATWKSSNLHVAIFLSPRGRESFLPKFHFILPKIFFFSTWRFSISYVGTVAKVNSLTWGILFFDLDAPKYKLFTT